MTSKNLAEALAKRYLMEFHKATETYGLAIDPTPWEDLTADSKGIRIAAMGEVLDWLGLLGLHVQYNNGKVAVFTDPVKTAPQPQAQIAPPVTSKKQAHAEAQAAGFTGDVCTTCGGMKVVRTGACAVCRDCGSTSSCS